jgi:hypothetical protein
MGVINLELREHFFGRWLWKHGGVRREEEEQGATDESEGTKDTHGRRDV